MKKETFLKIQILILVALLIVTTGFRCKFITPGQKQLLQPINLTWWGTFDDPQNFSEIIADYQTLHPNIKINYRKLRSEEFTGEVVNALAEDRGPDILSIHNTDIIRWFSKLEPLPPTTKMAYQITKKSLGLKEETLIEIRETPSLTPGKIKEYFLDVVYDDVVINEKIYGLPLSIDTLVMYYNRDLFNNAGIPLPPTNWTDLQSFVKKLTYQNKEGQLIQSGVALGTAYNVEQCADILSLLMMQNGAQMTEGGKVTFHLLPAGVDKTYNPGPDALRFYTDFASPGKEVYTWNYTFANSIDAFAQGKVAMIFGYSYHLPYIEAIRQGKLNYGIAKIPQIEGRPEVNFANYWVQTVSKKSKYINEAWDFIQFIIKKDEAKKYLTKMMRPTALRSLVEEQLNNDQLKVFADQLLTSKSWYHGQNKEAMENVFKEMIDSVILQSIEPKKATQLAAEKIQQTL